jgi:hypothetical protein
MKNCFIGFFLSVFFAFCGVIFPQQNAYAGASKSALPGFSVTPYYDEQVMTINYSPEVRIYINAPSISSFNPAKRTGIALFALPNGNTIEQTFGKVLKSGDDWHYDIQHIGAQTRFIREHETDYNLVTVYLENTQLSWPTWRGKYSNNAVIIKNLIDSVKSIFNAYNPFVILTGHSGGGSFTFGYLNGVTNIDNSIERIAFLDSDYNYDDSYGQKILNWINASPNHYLCVIAYNDSVALLNGAPIVSATGGTWYRSKMMEKYLSNNFPFTTTTDSVFIKYAALNGRVKFILKQNPLRQILHTVQVELNGFIEGVLSGTPAEEKGYTYYGARAYTKYIQNEITLPKQLTIPARPTGSKTGSEFMNYVSSMSFSQREDEILKEFKAGNIPDFMRTLRRITINTQDASGTAHKVQYEVMPDYLCIGSNTDFCRVPMGPVTAQKIANAYGAALPTSMLVDSIYFNADVKLEPVTYTPVGNQNELVSKFIEHNTAIEAQRTASGKPLGNVVGGIKKDVILSAKIVEKPNNVVIYGWHRLDGTAIQPVYNGHINSYVDYSHGIRLINREILVDSVVKDVLQILKDPVMYKILSNESSAMTQPGYISDAYIPGVPKSFGVRAKSSTSLEVVVKPDTLAKEYTAQLSSDGLNFTSNVKLTPDNMVIPNLQSGQLVFIRISAGNEAGTSAYSEVLCGVPSASSYAIIVNGFDRTSAGNTFNFVRQHASAIYSTRLKRFDSATNDAIIDGVFLLNDYSVADYILGDESTANETFSDAEQTLIKNYLYAGGSLFASGCELAWDLDAKGTASDKNFIWNYLKTKYIADAPNGTSSTYYKAEGFQTPSFLTGIEQFSFDNGQNGTFDVKWPDAIKGTMGGAPFLKYSGVDTSICAAGVCYKGKYGGSLDGHVVIMGIPFETIYPESARNSLMQKILSYFDIWTGVTEKNQSPQGFILCQNYPNPFNPETQIEFSIPSKCRVSLKIYDILGKEITSLINEEKEAGNYKIGFNAAIKSIASGIYFYTLKAGGYSASKSMVLLK